MKRGPVKDKLSKKPRLSPKRRRLLTILNEIDYSREKLLPHIPALTGELFDYIEFEDLEYQSIGEVLQYKPTFLSIIVGSIWLTDDYDGEFLIRILNKFRDKFTKEYLTTTRIYIEMENYQDNADLFNILIYLACKYHIYKPLELLKRFSWQLSNIDPHEAFNPLTLDPNVELDPIVEQFLDSIISTASLKEFLDYLPVELYGKCLEKLLVKFRDQVTINDLLKSQRSKLFVLYDDEFDFNKELDEDVIRSLDNLCLILTSIPGAIQNEDLEIPAYLSNKTHNPDIARWLNKILKLIQLRNDFFTAFEKIQQQATIGEDIFIEIIHRAFALQTAGYPHACNELGMHFHQCHQAGYAERAFLGVPLDYDGNQELCRKRAEKELASARSIYLLDKIPHLQRSLQFTFQIKDKVKRQAQLEAIAAFYIWGAKEFKDPNEKAIPQAWLDIIDETGDIDFIIDRFDEFKQSHKLAKKRREHQLVIGEQSFTPDEEKQWLDKLAGILSQEDNYARFNQVQAIAQKFVGTPQPNAVPLKWFPCFNQDTNTRWFLGRLQDLKRDVQTKQQLMTASHTDTPPQKAWQTPTLKRLTTS